MNHNKGDDMNATVASENSLFYFNHLTDMLI